MKTPAELIQNPPQIEAGAPFICLDEQAIKELQVESFNAGRVVGLREAAEIEELKIAVDNYLANGRPHGGRNTQFPDGCECDICQNWDSLNKTRNIDL